MWCVYVLLDCLQLSNMILDDTELNFYKWDGDVAALLDGVRVNINVMAEKWTPEQKERCLQETANSFKVTRHCSFITAFSFNPADPLSFFLSCGVCCCSSYAAFQAIEAR